MNFDNGTAYTESDADDEYEQASTSPVAGSTASAYNRSVGSSEHTPTTFDKRSSMDRLPETMISDWSADDCADFISSIGLGQYADHFIDNEIVGEALVALLHDDLKSMGIHSVGHRLTILKSVYDVKKAQDVPIEIDHYMPLSADAEAQYATATLKDIKMLVEQLRLRDERMSLVEQDARRLTEDFRRLREDVLPALRLAKDAQQPLPNLSSSTYSGFESSLSPLGNTPSTGGQSASSGLKRQFSARKITVPPSSKTSSTSPTHLQTNHDRTIVEQTLDPTIAAEHAVLFSNHLNALGGGSQTYSQGASSPQFQSPNMPSPTSPNMATTAANNHATLANRSYRSGGDQLTPARSTFSDDHASQYAPSIREASTSGNGGGGSSNSNSNSNNSNSNSSKVPPGSAPRRRETPVPDTPNSSSNASVEIFKSFRVSMDDPCYKVLPAALKKYQINAPWDHYALYIVYGDQERCLGLQEKPLILFKQLDREGKKPMFMLRRTNTAQPDQAEAPGSGGLSSRQYDPPGGII